jgi:hypothetical protein
MRQRGVIRPEKLKTPARIIIASGIPGCGRDEFLAGWVKYCEARGKRVRVYSAGDLMYEHFEEIGESIDPKHILDVDPGRLQNARSAVFQKILSEITDNPDKYDAVVICMHMWFRWNDVYLDAYDRFLKNFLDKATAFVTFINDFRPILRNLQSREQWRDQGLTGTEILRMQNIEVVSTYRVADLFNIPFHAVATTQQPSEFYKLVFHPEIETVYVGMPISHLRNPKDRKRIDGFIAKLSRYFRIVNPLSVEIVGAIHFGRGGKSPDNSLAVHRHIAHRDLYWFVHFSDIMVAYWPKVIPPEIVRENPEILKLWPKAIPSPGLVSEMASAHKEGKDVWTVFLESEASPFIIYHTTKLFLSEEEFFRFLEKKYPDRKDLVW